MTGPRVLIVEDDPELRGTLVRGLDEEGFRTEAVGRGSDLLARLLARPGEAVRRNQLAAAGWPHGAIVHPNTLDAYIARLRRKLRALPGAPRITTVRGVGYSVR